MNSEPTLTFTVRGIPKTAGSKTAMPLYTNRPLRKVGGRFDGKCYGRFAMKDSCDNKAWKAAVALAAKMEILRRAQARAALFVSPAPDPFPVSGPLIVEFKFWLPRPKNHWGTGRNLGKLKDWAPREHITYPDRTKLLRCAEDALKGIVWRDDSQIVGGDTTKDCVPTFETPPGVWVSVWRKEEA